MALLGFEFNLSGKTREELLAKQVYVFQGTPKQKKIIPPKLKGRQIQSIIKLLIGMQDEVQKRAQKEESKTKEGEGASSFFLNMDFMVNLLPILFGVSKEEFEELGFEDWEYLLIQFEVKNQYFLQILKRAGILHAIQKIRESFGKKEEKPSKDSKGAEGEPRLGLKEKSSQKEGGEA